MSATSAGRHYHSFDAQLPRPRGANSTAQATSQDSVKQLQLAKLHKTDAWISARPRGAALLARPPIYTHPHLRMPPRHRRPRDGLWIHCRTAQPRNVARPLEISPRPLASMRPMFPTACASRGTMPAPPRDRGAGQQSTDAGGNTRRVVAGLLAAWRCHVRRQRRAQGSNQLIAICEAARSSESRFYQSTPVPEPAATSRAPIIPPPPTPNKTQ